MKDIRLYQIYYDDDTRRQLDPGFIPLDNSANERPDWFEYWPIRSLFAENNFSEETWIGVFSPKFLQKAGMMSHQVKTAVQNSNADLVSFSPWFAHIALFKNIFYQIEFFHSNIMPSMREISVLLTGKDLTEKPMTSRQAIYCNYFVTTVKVWRKWLNLTDLLFKCAENPGSALGAQLNRFSGCDFYKGYPNKIFILETLISMLAIESRLDVEYAVDLNSCSLGLGFDNSAENIELLTLLDQMKLEPDGMTKYDQVRKELLAIHYGNYSDEAFA